jgi:5-methylcytosine-specific restriction endonuclease McrA
VDIVKNCYENRIPTRIRKEVYERDEYICILCQKPGAIHLHHHKHRSQGGKHTVNNLVCLCPICHEVAHGGYTLDLKFPYDMETAQDTIEYYLQYSIIPDELYYPF